MVSIGWSCEYFLLFIYMVFVECSSSLAFSHIQRKRQTSTCVLPPHPSHGEWAILGGSGEPEELVLMNTLLVFKCDSQYKLDSASPYVLCNKGWSSNMPSCEKMCPAIYSTLTITVTCKNKDDRKIGCDEATHGSYLTYTCAPYYETPPRFKKVIFCFNGVWSSSQPVCQPVCGRKVDSDVLPIIAGGTPAKTLEFPWVVALYRKKTKQEYKYICGGSIISRRVTLTAAHCVTDQYGASLPVENFQLAAGKLYSPYKDARDATAQYLAIHLIKITPQYRGGSRRFLGDLAILVTEEMFELSPVVQPVCFNGVNDISLQVGHIGEIAGWGNTETDEPSDEMKFLQIPYKKDDVCESELSRDWSDKYNLVDKMCAGFYNQSKSLCKGDSGSGLAFKHYEDNRFYVYGIASLSPIGPEGKCNVQQNALYTKVALYYEFIDRMVALYQEQDFPVKNNITTNDHIRPVESITYFPSTERSHPIPKVQRKKVNVPVSTTYRTDVSGIMENSTDFPNSKETDSTPKVRTNATDLSDYKIFEPIPHPVNTWGAVYSPFKCPDNASFPHCNFVLKSKQCTDPYYGRQCCKSCVIDGQIPAFWIYSQPLNPPKPTKPLFEGAQ